MKSSRFFVLAIGILVAASYSFSQDKDQQVYVTKTGKKYHVAGCSYLKSSRAISLEEAIRSYSPCSRCNPPTEVSEEKGSTEKKDAVKKDGQTQEKVQKQQTSTSGRCQATTKKGTQCKRKAKAGSSYCWQHG